ncbi:MAG: hypothetical protein ACU83V_11300 [Gammaproteobacteria bacterium]
MGPHMLHEQLIEEIKQIPGEKLEEIYDLIHYFRLGLAQEKQMETISRRPIGLAKGLITIPAGFFEPLPDEILDAFEGKK